MICLEYLNNAFALKAYRKHYRELGDPSEIVIKELMKFFHKDFEAVDSVCNVRKQIENEIEEILRYDIDRSEPRELPVTPFIYDTFEANYVCVTNVRIYRRGEEDNILQGLVTCVTPCIESEKFDAESSWIDIYPNLIPTDNLFQIIEQMQLFNHII